MRSQLWVVGKNASETSLPIAWELCGVFDDYATAARQCVSYSHFVGPVILNDIYPIETTTWEGLHFPKSESPDGTYRKDYLEARGCSQ
jgi:hypothetical protein